MPGGVLKPIPRNVERAIRQQAPAANWESLKGLAEQYQLERDHLQKKEAPSQTRASLDNIIERAVLLRRDLLMLKEESTYAIGGWRLIDATAQQLLVLAQAGKAGHNEIVPRAGRPASLKQGFVRSVAGVLERDGYAVDATPNGLLVAVVSDLLDVYSDKPADVPALVRSALRENPSETS
jgi:hypothetical protein